MCDLSSCLFLFTAHRRASLELLQRAAPSCCVMHIAALALATSVLTLASPGSSEVMQPSERHRAELHVHINHRSVLMNMAADSKEIQDKTDCPTS